MPFVPSAASSFLHPEPSTIRRTVSASAYIGNTQRFSTIPTRTAPCSWARSTARPSAPYAGASIISCNGHGRLLSASHSSAVIDNSRSVCARWSYFPCSNFVLIDCVITIPFGCRQATPVRINDRSIPTGTLGASPTLTADRASLSTFIALASTDTVATRSNFSECSFDFGNDAVVIFHHKVSERTWELH